MKASGQGVLLECGFGFTRNTRQWCCSSCEDHTLRAQTLSLCGIGKPWGGGVDCKLGCRLSQVSGSEGKGAWLMVTQSCQLRGALMWPDSGPVSPSGLKLLQLFFQGLSSQRSCCRRVGQMWEMLYLPVWPGFRWWEKDFPPVLGAWGSCLLTVPHVQDSGVKCSDHYAVLDIQGRYWPTLLFFNS